MRRNYRMKKVKKPGNDRAYLYCVTPCPVRHEAYFNPKVGSHFCVRQCEHFAGKGNFEDHFVLCKGKAEPWIKRVWRRINA